MRTLVNPSAGDRDGVPRKLRELGKMILFGSSQGRAVIPPRIRHDALIDHFDYPQRDT